MNVKLAEKIDELNKATEYSDSIMGKPLDLGNTYYCNITTAELVQLLKDLNEEQSWGLGNVWNMLEAAIGYKFLKENSEYRWMIKMYNRDMYIKEMREKYPEYWNHSK